jgi:hypothetical protein
MTTYSKVLLSTTLSGKLDQAGMKGASTFFAPKAHILFLREDYEWIFWIRYPPFLAFFDHIIRLYILDPELQVKVTACREP